MAINIEMNILQSNGTTYETLYPKTSTSNLEGTLSSSQLPSSIPASNISGTLSTSNIPNLSASKITSGTLSVARGGTGNTSLSGLASELRNYLGIENKFITYEKGVRTGTGIKWSNMVNNTLVVFNHIKFLLAFGYTTYSGIITMFPIYKSNDDINYIPTPIAFNNAFFFFNCNKNNSESTINTTNGYIRLIFTTSQTLNVGSATYDYYVGNENNTPYYWWGIGTY